MCDNQKHTPYSLFDWLRKTLKASHNSGSSESGTFIALSEKRI